MLMPLLLQVYGCQKRCSFFCYSVRSWLRAIKWVAYNMNCCQMIDVANNYDDFFFHITKRLCSYVLYVLFRFYCNFWRILQEIETGFCYLTKVLYSQQKFVGRQKKLKIFYIFSFAVHPTDKVFFPRSRKNFFYWIIQNDDEQIYPIE